MQGLIRREWWLELWVDIYISPWGNKEWAYDNGIVYQSWHLSGFVRNKIGNIQRRCPNPHFPLSSWIGSWSHARLEWRKTLDITFSNRPIIILKLLILDTTQGDSLICRELYCIGFECWSVVHLIRSNVVPWLRENLSSVLPRILWTTIKGKPHTVLR